MVKSLYSLSLLEAQMTNATSKPIAVGPITVQFLLDAEASGGALTLQRVDVPGGQGVPLPHSHDGFEETVYGLSGVLAFTVDGERVEVGPGDALHIRRGAVHSFVAEDGDASALAVATPGVFGPAYFHALAAVIDAAAGGPPDRDAVFDVMLRHGLTPAVPATG
jgi:quercetin dioxygenase-like cupin family protein